MLRKKLSGIGQFKVEFQGVNQNSLRTLLTEVHTGIKIVNNIYVEDKEVISKTSKKLYVNGYGRFSYAEDEKSLPSWFFRGDVREAFVGEKEVISLLLAMCQGEFEDDFVLSKKLFFQGDLQSLCDGEVVALVVGDKVYNNYLPSFTYVQFKNELKYSDVVNKWLLNLNYNGELKVLENVKS